MYQPGDTIDRYTIEALLGEGGMGAVYRAHDMRLNRRVAVKILRIPQGKAGSSAAAARLLREARAVASFEHPNAVTIFDVNEVDGRPYIVMELIAGKTLREYIPKGSATWRKRVKWMADAARALGAAHRAGIVHRDVKPENIMIRDDGSVKVLDFGIARKHTSAAPGSIPSRAATGGAAGTRLQESVLGSPMYMSPEQFENKGVDGRSDQFSWAICTYHVLAGEPPWDWRDDQDLVELAASIMLTEPRPLRELAPEVPGGVADVLDRALRKYPDERFATMEECVLALEDAAGLTGSGMHALPASLPEREITRPTPAAETKHSTPPPASSDPERTATPVPELPNVEPPLMVARASDPDVSTQSGPRLPNLARIKAEELLASQPQAQSQSQPSRDSKRADPPPVESSVRAREPSASSLSTRTMVAGAVLLAAGFGAGLLLRGSRSASHPTASAMTPTSPPGASAGAAGGEASALYRLGLERARAGAWDEARGLYERALELDPQLVPAWRALVEACREHGCPRR